MACSRICSSVALLFAASIFGHAQTWDGGSGLDHWTASSNWNPNGIPANDGTANIVFSGLVRLTPDVNIAQDILSLSFNSAAGAFVIDGTTLSIRGGGITNDDGDLQTIDAPITLLADQTWNASAGPLSFGAAPFANGGFTLTVTGDFDTTIDFGPTGAGGLNKFGAGTLTMNGAGYSGTTTIDEGTLRAGDDNSLSGNPFVISAGAILDVNGFSDLIGLISGAGTIQLPGASQLATGGLGSTSFDGVIVGDSTAEFRLTALHTLTLNGLNTFPGTFAIQTATLLTGANERIDDAADVVIELGGVFSTSGAHTETVDQVTLHNGSIDFDVSGGGTLNANSFDFRNGTVEGTIGGPGGVTKAHGGTVTVLGAMTYSGSTSVSVGELSLVSNGALPGSTDLTVISPGIVSIAASAPNKAIGSLAGDGSLVLSNAAGCTIGGNNASTSFSGVISGTGSVTKSGSGTLLINGANTFTGATTVLGGALQIGAADRLSDSTDLAVNGSAATFDLQTFNETVDVVTLSGGSIIGSGVLTGSGYFINSGIISARLGGTAMLTKLSAGTGTLSGSNSYSGGTQLNAGVLQVSSNSNLGSISGGMTFSGGTLRNTSGFISSRAIVLNAGGGTIDTLASLTLNGAVSGTGALTKSGSGTLTLGSGNSYGGGTALNAGVLQVGSNSNLGSISGGMTFNSGTLRNTSVFSSSRALVLNSGGGTIETAADLTLSGAISGPGTMTKSGAARLSLTTAFPQLAALTISNGTLGLTPSAVLNVLGSVTLASPATFELDDNVINAAGFSNSGEIVGDGRLQGPLNNSVGGELRVMAGDEIWVANAAPHLNAGTIEIIGGAVEFDGPLTNSGPTGLINAVNADLSFDAGLLNFSSIDFNSGNTVLVGQVTNQFGASIDVFGGGVATFSDDVLNNGQILTSGGAASYFLGAVSGIGSFPGAGTVHFEASVRPGVSPAVVNIGGAMVLGGMAAVEIEVGGLVPGVQHDQLVVAQNAILNGALLVTLINGFSPSSGDTFDVLTAGIVQGTFAFEVLPPGFTIEYLVDRVRLHFDVPPPCDSCDTDCNGTVNPFDIQPFLDLLSTTPPPPCSPCAGDANNNGTVNPFDINAFLECLS